MHEGEKWSRSVVSNSSWPHGPQPTRLLHPWDFPGMSAGVGCHCLLWKSAQTVIIYFLFLWDIFNSIDILFIREKNIFFWISSKKKLMLILHIQSWGQNIKRKIYFPSVQLKYPICFLLGLRLFATKTCEWKYLETNSCLQIYSVLHCHLSQPSKTIFFFFLSFFFPFYTVHGFLIVSILEWFAIFSSSRSHFARTPCYELSILGGPTWHAS